MSSQDDLLMSDQRRKTSWDQVEKVRVSRYGSRYLEYRRQYEAAARFEHEPTFPLYLMLEQTYHCNLQCPICIQGLSHERKAFEPTVPLMSWELFQQIVLEGERYQCPSIAMEVNDEPLLVKGLPRRIRFAREHGFMDVFMTTNGVLFTEKTVQEVIDAGVTHILFSIDAATRETYDKVRVGGDFQKVIEAIKMVRRYREERNAVLPLIRASFVQNRLNQHETEAFLEHLGILADFVEIQGFSSYYGHTDHLLPRAARKVEDFSCIEPWRKLIIRANGDVLPCCTFYGYELVLGNLRDLSLYELYNSLGLKGLRSEFRNGIYKAPACAACSRSFYHPSAKGGG